MKHDEIMKQVCVLVVSLAVSVVASVLTSFTPAEQTITSIALFVAFLLIDVVWLLASRAYRERKEYELWTVRDQADQELANIRQHFAEISQMSHGRRDLFVSHFMDSIHTLSRKIKDAADKQELRTGSNFYLRAEDIFEAFQGDENPVLRYTWPIGDADRLFEEPAWWRFFEVKARMVAQKTIKGARAILIVDDENSCNAPRLKKLLDFYHTNDGQECRVIVRSSFVRICAENEMPSNYLDFGIYGNRMLFRSEQYKPEYIGVYTKDPGWIRVYSKFFDALWDSPAVCKRNPSTCSEAVTCDALMTFDSQQESDGEKGCPAN